MPASTCDPVNTALRHALSSERSPCGGSSNTDLESRLIVSAKSVLNSHIEFEQSETYKSTVLDSLKSKYIVLGSPSSKTNQMTPEASKEDTVNEPKHILFPLEAVKLGWREQGWHTGVGMYNTGNTCYLNSTLQALFHVPALTNWLISDSDHRSNCDSCMVCAVAKTLLASQTKSQEPIRPWMVSSKLRLVCRHLVPGRQEDAHEFLRYLVEAMERAYIQRFHIENLDARSKETTPLNQILGGYLRSAVKCLQCRHVSTTVQHFQDLLLDIRKAGTLDEALQSYFACERLDDLAYRCESCRRKVSAVKQFSLERAPCVLCIQLKRFSGAGGKITKHIAFRQRLELSHFSHRTPATPLVYKLVALVTHMGMSANCGHYTAIGLTPSGTYYEFDDCSVRPVSQQIVLNTNAYIMFYELEKDSQQLNSDKINGKMPVKSKSTIVSQTPNKLSVSTNSPTLSQINSPATPKSTNIQQSSSITPFKTNMIPTPVRNKTLHLDENGKTESNFNSVKTSNKISENSTKLNGISLNSTTKLNSNNNIDSNSKINLNRNSSEIKTNCNDISRLLDSPPLSNNDTTSPTQSISENSISPKKQNSILNITESNLSSGKCENSPKKLESNNLVKNGLTKSDTPVINGTSNNRRLVPYDSDGGSSSTSEAEDAPSGKWLVSVRTNDCRAPSLNGDTGWRCQTKASADPIEHTENSNGNNSTVSQLLRTSHSGYGTSVVSWTGGRSALEKEVANERREQYKRHRTDIDDLDRGRSKKRRPNSNIPRSNPGYNPFQEYQQQNSNHRWQTSNNNNNGGFQKHFYNNTSNPRYHRRRFFHPNKHNRFHR